MSFKKKIKKELDRHERQWCDAVCPSVTKFGRQADKRISELEAKLEALREVIRKASDIAETGDCSWVVEVLDAALEGEQDGM